MINDAAQPTPELTVGDTKSSDPTTGPEALKVDWPARIEKCIRKREPMIKMMHENNNYRRGKPFGVQPEEDAVNVPIDWARTKNKAAQLFFQLPTIILEPKQDGLDSVAPIAAQALNDVMGEDVKAHVCMDEVLQDMINSAGFGAVYVGIEVTKKTVQMPQFSDTEMELAQQDPTHPAHAAIADNGGQMPMAPQDVPIYQCYFADRISPARLLWPVEFVGSDWQKADWLGFEGEMPFVEALRRKWVTMDFLKQSGNDKLKSTNEVAEREENQMEGTPVTYRHIYYRASTVHADEPDPRKIRHLVFIKDKPGDEPVVDEDFLWQKYNDQTMDWLGMTDFPIKVGTLTTLSDDATPPSDSQVGRPQVRELMRLRSQMVKQRDRSMPVRWFDVNQVDDDIAEQLRKGVYQDMIPMNGPGGNAIGEVARANFPRDSWEFQAVINGDLDESWSMGRNQQGLDTPGDTSATETNVVAQAANVRIEYERVRVLRFYLEIAEAVFSLMQLFQTDKEWTKLLGPNGAKTLQQWDRDTLQGKYAFDAHPDGAVRVDVSQRRVESLNLYKLWRQDPLVNPNELIVEVAKTHGLDPGKMLAQPQPPQPPPEAIRLALAGADLANPMAVALIQKHGGTPLTQQDIQDAKNIMQAAGVPSVPATQLVLPQPGDPGQPSSTIGSSMAAADTTHGGPAPEVNPLNQRYEQGTGGDHMLPPAAQP